MKRIGRGFIIMLVSIAVTALTGWGALAIYYSNLPGEEVRRLLAIAFAIFGAAALVWYLFSAKRTRPLLGFLCRVSCCSSHGGRRFHLGKIEIGRPNTPGWLMPRSTATW